MVLVTAGKIVEAEVAVRDSLRDALSVAGKYSQYTAIALSQLTRILREQGRLDEAAKLSAVVLEIQQQVGMPPDSALLNAAQADLGNIYADQGRWRDALNMFEGIKKSMPAKSYYLQASVDQNPNWPLALIENGHTRKARTAAAALAAITSDRFGAKHINAARAKGILAFVLARSGDRRGALALFRQAVPILITRSQQSEDEAVGRSSWIGGLA